MRFSRCILFGLVLMSCVFAVTERPVPGQTLLFNHNGGRSQEPKPQNQEPSDNHREALPLMMRAQELFNKANYNEAQPLAERALDQSKKEFGKESLLVTAPMSLLGEIVLEKGDFARARALFTEALTIRQKLNPQSRFVALALNNLSVVDRSEGDFARAEQRLLEALTIYLKVAGDGSADVALAQNNLSSLYLAKGNFTLAQERAQKALSIRIDLFGEEDLNVAASRTSLGLAYEAKGDYVRAEPELLAALTVREKLQGRKHPQVVAALSNLAILYKEKGDFKRAEEMYHRALNAFLGVNGLEENRFVATALGNLASLYGSIGKHSLSLGMHLKAWEVSQRTLAPGDPDLATPLANLGLAYIATGDYTRAGQYLTQAGEIIAKTFGREHPSYAWILGERGGVAELNGDYQQAEDLYRQSLAIKRKVFGDGSPEVGKILDYLGALFWRKGERARAIDCLSDANDVRERYLAQILVAGSEYQKRLFLQTMTADTYRAISLNALSWPENAEAIRLALATILQRKGRALDAMSSQIRALRERATPEDRAFLDKIVNVRTELATHARSGPGKLQPEKYRELIDKLTRESEELEGEIGKRTAEVRSRLQEAPVTVERVQAAIPQGAALIELAIYQPYDLRAKDPLLRFGDAQYIAYVLKPGVAPRPVDLGVATKVDDAIRKFRAALRQPSKPDARISGRALDELVMRPVRKLLGPVRTLLISPDGALNLIPFAALVDENDHYLVEKYTISYLTSGRDLLLPRVPKQSRQPPVAFADPDFDLTTQEVATGSRTTEDLSEMRPVDLERTRWPRLPGTIEVADAFKVMFPNSRVYAQQQATESTLKLVAGPYILHVATHGFFLDNSRGQNQLALAEGSLSQSIDNPLLRSGLVLAGANNFQGGNGEDGIITALEVSGLDLWGTKLAVLSACETGLGEVQNGEGVYGLRRALVLAGAESQVISLWKINDDSTKTFMESYYHRLKTGEERSAALRKVQLEMLHAEQGDSDQRHPYFWASFIESGDWRSLGDK